MREEPFEKCRRNFCFSGLSSLKIRRSLLRFCFAVNRLVFGMCLNLLGLEPAC